MNTPTRINSIISPINAFSAIFKLFSYWLVIVVIVVVFLAQVTAVKILADYNHINIAILYIMTSVLVLAIVTEKPFGFLNVVPID